MMDEFGPEDPDDVLDAANERRRSRVLEYMDARRSTPSSTDVYGQLYLDLPRFFRRVLLMAGAALLAGGLGLALAGPNSPAGALMALGGALIALVIPIRAWRDEKSK